MTTMRQLLASGELEGFEPSDVMGATMGEPAASKADCKECGKNGLVYVEYSKGYWVRSFQVCPECQTSEEF
jgi:hypothetical protein